MDEMELVNSIRNVPLREEGAIITVMGVGGAGGNALRYMHSLSPRNITMMVCNTDAQVLASSPIRIRIQLGTAGTGAGNNPDIGRQSALESIDDVLTALQESNTNMLFITAGMGGGTGTGAAPVIAKAARQRGILTVGITTLPLESEGPVRVRNARKGLEEFARNVDSLVVLHNDNIAKIYGSLPYREAFHKADEILTDAATAIAELITREGMVNVDFADVKSVLLSSGVAVMGTAKATGEFDCAELVRNVLTSPLLNDRDVRGAKDILMNISYGPGNEISLDSTRNILSQVQKMVSRGIYSNDANIIWGAGEKPELGDNELELTIIASRFDREEQRNAEADRKPQADSRRADDESGVVIVRRKDRYGDIDSIWNSPSYLRDRRSLTDAMSGKPTRRHDELSVNETGDGAVQQDLFPQK